MKKQFNVFDSSSLDPDYVSILEKPCCNLITNFKELVTEFNPWKQHFGTFQMSSPPSYPQQSTSYYFLFDCGIFAILYLENLTARGMKPFNTIQTHCSMSGSTLRRSFSSILKTPSTQRTSFKLC
uniref:Ubiquitin-like protease family profile domain-containing protein n=1 Tax=Triticum urartu TaxID=4572 RepID=A0A8R7Q2K2_TRIUA